jgi:serine/threonine-protein kinase
MSLMTNLKALFQKKEAAQPSPAAPDSPKAASSSPKATAKGPAKAPATARRSAKCDIRRRFEILKEATAGTMSNFYRARDRESGKIVGVKVLDKDKTAAFEARFQGLKKPSEGEISAVFDHPNIVKTYEYGLTTNNEQYLVMEYIDGPGFNTLILGQDALLDGLRVPLIRQIAEGLKAVHEAGYIHRDICPRNVMVDTESGVLKLIDFGLTVPATPEFMQPGNRTGNPNYMAPELVRRMKTDHRLDVFAFGVTAYEICTFQLPWARGIKGDVAMMHASYPPNDITKYRPQIDPKLGKAIMWCLDQNVEKRCPTMEAFLKATAGLVNEDAS